MTSFLFAPEHPGRMAAIRIGLGLVLLYDAAMHWPYVVELYSSDGMPMPLLPGTFFEPHAFSAGVCVVLYSILLFALTAVVAGWQTRVSLLIAFVLTAMLGLLDPPGTFKKYSVIALHLLFLLACSRPAALASVDAWVNREPNRLVRLTPAWPRRLMQVLISSVYLGAVITKIRLPDFGSGDLLMFSLLDERWGGNWLGMWLATQPRLLMFVSYGTVILELAGALLLWIPATRFPMLLVMMLFHVSIAATLHVGIFSPTMIVALLAFSEPRDAETLKRFAARFRRHRGKQRAKPPAATGATPEPASAAAGFRRRAASAGIYLLAGAAFAGAGYAQQSIADYSGVFHGDASGEWKYISPEVVDDFLSPRKQHPADYFHRVEIGSRLGFLQSFGERKRFKRGMTVFIVARLTQAHPKLNIEWILQPPGDLDPFSQTKTLDHGVPYAWFGFRLNSEDHPTGAYMITVKADGRVVARKFFQLVDD